MKSIAFVFFLIVLLNAVDIVFWSFPAFFSLSAYLKVTVLAGLAYCSHTDTEKAENDGSSINFKYISEMIFLFYFSLWFALLHHTNVDYISKVTGIGLIAAAFATFSLIVSLVEKLMYGSAWHKLTLFAMKILMYTLLATGGYILVFGEWRWELIFIIDMF